MRTVCFFLFLVSSFPIYFLVFWFFGFLFLVFWFLGDYFGHCSNKLNKDFHSFVPSFSFSFIFDHLIYKSIHIIGFAAEDPPFFLVFFLSFFLYLLDIRSVPLSLSPGIRLISDLPISISSRTWNFLTAKGKFLILPFNSPLTFDHRPSSYLLRLTIGTGLDWEVRLGFIHTDAKSFSRVTGWLAGYRPSLFR